MLGRAWPELLAEQYLSEIGAGEKADDPDKLRKLRTLLHSCTTLLPSSKIHCRNWRGL
jgi:hypothetical protein